MPGRQTHGEVDAHAPPCMVSRPSLTRFPRPDLRLHKLHQAKGDRPVMPAAATPASGRRSPCIYRTIRSEAASLRPCDVQVSLVPAIGPVVHRRTCEPTCSDGSIDAPKSFRSFASASQRSNGPPLVPPGSGLRAVA